MGDGDLVLLDGPMGTALEARGIEIPGPLWTAVGVIDHPDAVADVHREYAAAGAQVHTTATFRTTARALAGTPHADRWQELVADAVRLCHEGAGEGAVVAGSVASLEDCYRPDLTPASDVLRNEHSALAQALADADADLLLVETMPTLGELAIATRCAAATGLPVWSAVTLGPAGEFLDRDGVLTAAALAEDAGAEAFGLNCMPPALITPLLETLADARQRPPRLLAYGNALFPGHDVISPDEYLEHARRWRELGADIIGTCCGTTPAHLAALRALD
jgi:S-methylmethionine-dependent homocysteine/selenocysteine methylase